MVTCEERIKELREELARRDDVPKDFSDTAEERPRSHFREYRSNWEHLTWQIGRDNGALYPSEASYAPYLEPI